MVDVTGEALRKELDLARAKIEQLEEDVEHLTQQLQDAEDAAMDVTLRDEEWEEALQEAIALVDEETAYHILRCFEHLTGGEYDDR